MSKTDVDLAYKYINKQKNAQSRGIKFELSFGRYKKLVNTKRCYYTGVVLNNTDENDPLYRTLDRKDNTIGYTDKNTVVCCQRFNKAKGTASLEDIRLMYKKLFAK